jgi:hypothetical protein
LTCFLAFFIYFSVEYGILHSQIETKNQHIKRGGANLMQIKIFRPTLYGLASLYFLLSYAVTSAQARQQQESKPVKLVVKTDMKSYAIGAKAALEIIIQDANNKSARAAKDYIIEIELRSTSARQPTKKMQDTIKAGEISVKLQLPLEEAGLFNIHAGHLAKMSELYPGDTVILVKRAIKSLQKPKRGAWVPGFEVRLAGAGMTASPPPPQFVSEPGQGTFLLLKSSPQRTLLADGKDAATIHVFYSSEEGDGLAPNDIRVRLFNSGGTLEPSQALIIPKGEDYTHATLTSDKTGAVTVEYLGSTPNVPPPTERRLQIQFVPPITQIDLDASPPAITLVDQSDLIVRLLDEKGTPIATDTSRQISFAIERGRGEIDKKELEIPARRSEGRTTFLPTWIGTVEISAATPDLRPVTKTLQVSPPLMPLGLSALGGLAGGLIAFWVGQKLKWWRIAIGLITGFVLYWAFVFGVLDFLPRAIVLNPLSAFVLSTLGGWLGTEVFTKILNRFGLVP